MRIVIDMQGAQTESRFRGIGRYTMDFVQAVVRNRGDYEIILALNGLFPNTIEPICAAFYGLLPQENIRVWKTPGPVQEGRLGNESRRETAELIREAFLASLKPDVIHISSLFEGYVDDAVTSIGRFDTATPVSVVIYDLIPLLNPDHYLKPNPRYERYYMSKIKHLLRATLNLAISDFSREEVITTLGVAKNSVTSISTAINGNFQRQPIDEVTASQLRQELGIQRPFVLYTGGSDERKNLPRLIEAYAALPLSLRDRHQLLFAGKMSEGDILHFKHVAHSAGLNGNDLIISGYVSDDKLIQLYNLCQLHVFPSWHEGFGMPALEAMACGAPVIGANTSSLPEVIGLNEALFDPFDVSAIAQKLAHALDDEAFRFRLREHGLHQARKFSWDITARRAIQAWESIQRNQSGERESWRITSERLANNYRRLVHAVASFVATKSAIADEELREIAVCIESNERQLDRYLRPRALPLQITWRIEGPFDSSYSLALVNREIARALAALGHRVVLHSTEGPGDFAPNEKFLSENPDLAAMHRQLSDVASVDADVVSRNLYPPRVADMTARFNFLHAYGWEESGFPLDWVDAFNFSLQGMTVMSEHVRKIMIDHGVTLPIKVSSLGVDHWHRVESERDFQLNARSFRFLHVSSCFPRKGADVMLQSYGRAFRASDDVTLIIKTFPNPHNEIHRWLDQARAKDPDYPDVVILEEDYTDAKLKALYMQCHALVAPSRAEGFGLPMAEALLSDLAVITTRWSGQTDFCTPDTSWLIDYTFARAKTHFGLFDTVWAEPDAIHLADLMKEVYETPEEKRRIRISAGQRLLSDKFKWSQAAVRMVEAANNCAEQKEASKPRIGWVTSWNTRCGIATYSEQLIKNIPDEIKVLAASTSSMTANDGPNVIRCWEAGDHEPLINLRRIIDQLQIDTLVIQFNYGFFNLENLAKFLDEQIELRRTVVVMMHSTSDPAHVPHKKLKVLASALACCHRLMVHAPGDLNRLKDLGLIENVTIFPHGILNYQQTSNEEKNTAAFRIASYGFFLPHKGLLELIEAVHILRQQGRNIYLSMINAEYPVSASRELIGRAVEKILEYGIGEYVEICSDYLTDEDSLRRLHKADMVIFPYQNTGESSSAAVRYGLAVGRPVIVTPISIFDDVSQAVYYLPGQSASDIAKGVSEFIQDVASGAEVIKEIEENAERWRAAHSYSLVGMRLYGILCALKKNENLYSVF